MQFFIDRVTSIYPFPTLFSKGFFPKSALCERDLKAKRVRQFFNWRKMKGEKAREFQQQYIRKGGGLYCFSYARPSVCPFFRPSVVPFVTNIFCRTFFSNHASQPLHTWYGTSAKGLTRRLPNSGPPVIYFLFHDLVYFPTIRL